MVVLFLTTVAIREKGITSKRWILKMQPISEKNWVDQMSTKPETKVKPFLEIRQVNDKC